MSDDELSRKMAGMRTSSVGLKDNEAMCHILLTELCTNWRWRRWARHVSFFSKCHILVAAFFIVRVPKLRMKAGN